jgi:hypothetical protein
MQFRATNFPALAIARRAAVCLAALLIMVCTATADEAKFLRGINLNGSELTIDGRAWDADNSPQLQITGKRFDNSNVPLKPKTDDARATMIRSSVWGDDARIIVSGLGNKVVRVFVYIWEDNDSERFDLLLNDRVVARGVESGGAGNWKRLGPFAVQRADGTITLSSQGGAANLSGIEIWSSDGEIPTPEAAAFAAKPTEEQLAFFEKRIRPVLAERCYECHSAKSETVQGGLLLDSRAGIIKGGDNGPVILPGEPEASLLVKAIRHADPGLTMPPEEKLADDQIADFERWVKERAPDPRTEDTLATVKAKSAIDWDKAKQWWSLKPIATTSPPSVKSEDWPKNEIDRFILAKIEAEGLVPASDAAKRTLIRRATYDLIGLPPTPEEVAAFLSDESPEAFAKVVDGLLDSPRYGERWGRHWLDVVRYADTAGDNSDFPIPQMRHYRDWVIKAFNNDLPYNQFAQAQIAGDLLPKSQLPRRDALIATGYLANARRFGSRVEDYPQHLTIEDTIDNFGRAFLGLTVNCARCHDHKFDPIPTTDYYALYGIFNSTQYPWPGIELDQQQRRLIPLADPSVVETFEKEKAEKQKELDEIVKQKEKALQEAKDDAKKALEEEQKKAKETAANNSRREPPYEMIYAVTEANDRGDASLQLKGDPSKPGEIVPRHFLTALGGQSVPPDDSSSGRLRLSQWLFDENNPLPARVMVNRIWLHHFGRGIVPTPNDFGKQGKPPTHPELLDYLARQFIADGWSIKSMHRRIMLSRTYQLSSTRSPEAIAKDASNAFLSSFPRQRLDAEALRDALLTLGESLDLSPPEAHPFPPQSKWNFTQHNPFKAVYETNRRSVYMMTQRIQRHPFLSIFDGADPSVSTPQRGATTTPLQALFLLNDPLVHQQAERFAGRIEREGDNDNARIARAYQLALSRPPSHEESTEVEQFLTAVRTKLQQVGKSPEEAEHEAWKSFARVLFRLNEFCYLD